MPLPFLPLVIATLAGGAFYQSKFKEDPLKGQLTPERALIFETALNEVKDSKKLMVLAKVFRENGLLPQADLLEKRAKLRDLPPDIKTARKAAFRKGMSSTNPEAVMALAKAYYNDGATGAAQALREYAISLKNGPSPVAAPAVSPPVVSEGVAAHG